MEHAEAVYGFAKELNDEEGGEGFKAEGLEDSKVGCWFPLVLLRSDLSLYRFCGLHASERLFSFFPSRGGRSHGMAL